MRTFIRLGGLLLAPLLCTAVLAQQRADNTRTNQNYSSSENATADNQKQDSSDIKITQQIRKSVMSDKNLSTYAHNVKIVAVNGNVTLSGVVRSQDEKRTVASKATEVAGSGHVIDDLKVAPPR
jgi:hyperosmotically inducible protein